MHVSRVLLCNIHAPVSRPEAAARSRRAPGRGRGHGLVQGGLCWRPPRGLLQPRHRAPQRRGHGAGGGRARAAAAPRPQARGRGRRGRAGPRVQAGGLPRGR